MRARDYAILALILCLFIAVNIKIVGDARDCESRGGTLLRAAVGFECVVFGRAK